MTNDTGNITISRSVVPDSDRIDIPARLFGLNFPLRLEPTIYGITQRIAEEYTGGFWHFYTLSNGGFYMAPDHGRTFSVSCMNYWQGTLSPDALGIVSCLTAYSHLSFGKDDEFPAVCARHYYLLREYMLEHAEVGAILGAID